MSTGEIDPRVRIGHVHLKVADIERALAFYCGVLGFALTQRYGPQGAFVSAGDYHHHIGLNTWESQGGSPPARGTTGLYHLAILYPTRAELADAVRWVLKAEIPIEGATDHGVSEAITCATRTAMALSFIGTDRKNNGRATLMEAWPCSRAHWILTCCSKKLSDQTPRVCSPKQQGISARRIAKLRCDRE